MFENDATLGHMFPYRPISQFLSSSPGEIHSVQPDDTVLSALKVLADNHVGMLVVLEGDKLVGVMSERDYARKVVLAGRRPESTTVGEIMTRDVVTVGPDAKYRDCMLLMNKHRFRHMPVVDGGRVIRVISILDILREAVAHHEKVIAELERERMTIFNSQA